MILISCVYLFIKVTKDADTIVNNDRKIYYVIYAWLYLIENHS